MNKYKSMDSKKHVYLYILGIILVSSTIIFYRTVDKENFGLSKIHNNGGFLHVYKILLQTRDTNDSNTIYDDNVSNVKQINNNASFVNKTKTVNDNQTVVSIPSDNKSNQKINENLSDNINDKLKSKTKVSTSKDVLFQYENKQCVKETNELTPVIFKSSLYMNTFEEDEKIYTDENLYINPDKMRLTSQYCHSETKFPKNERKGDLHIKNFFKKNEQQNYDIDNYDNEILYNYETKEPPVCKKEPAFKEQKQKLKYKYYPLTKTLKDEGVTNGKIPHYQKIDLSGKPYVYMMANKENHNSNTDTYSNSKKYQQHADMSVPVTASRYGSYENIDSNNNKATSKIRK